MLEVVNVLMAEHLHTEKALDINLQIYDCHNKKNQFQRQ